jgi:hypothetical protein
MIYPFQSSYRYDDSVIRNWKSSNIGVYYCGKLGTDGSFITCYVGRAICDIGIRGRLLQHLAEEKWSDVTHFGYKVCSTISEAINHEAEEIARLRPKYNTIGK